MTIETSYYAILLDNGKIKHLTKNQAEAYYLDYVNNFLTISGFASFYGMAYHSASGLIRKFQKDIHSEKLRQCK